MAANQRLLELPTDGPKLFRLRACRRRQATSSSQYASLRVLRPLLREEAMKLSRRQFLPLAAGAAVLSAASPIAWAQGYPARPVRIMVGFSAGGTQDIVARLIGQCLSKRLGQQFIVENRPGANSTLAIETIVRAAADGYTLGVIGIANVLNATLYDKLSFDLSRDLAMVAGLNSSPLVLEVHPALPVHSVPEFIAHAKSNPGKIAMASYGSGSISHVAAELFKKMTGINTAHVPYRGSAPMLTDLLGGQVAAAFDNLPASVEYIRAGKLRALGVTTATRSAALPHIPSLSELLPGYEASAFFGIGAPKDTPAAIIDKLNEAINASLADPKLAGRLAELGGAPLVLSSAAFGKLIVDETEKWAKVIQAANIKQE
jgi:tripartite-type tricarboxylate transporter receptor subunit TctC